MLTGNGTDSGTNSTFTSVLPLEEVYFSLPSLVYVFSATSGREPSLLKFMADATKDLQASTDFCLHRSVNACTRLAIMQQTEHPPVAWGCCPFGDTGIHCCRHPEAGLHHRGKGREMSPCGQCWSGHQHLNTRKSQIQRQNNISVTFHHQNLSPLWSWVR